MPLQVSQELDRILAMGVGLVSSGSRRTSRPSRRRLGLTVTALMAEIRSVWRSQALMMGVLPRGRACDGPSAGELDPGVDGGSSAPQPRKWATTSGDSPCSTSSTARSRRRWSSSAVPMGLIPRVRQQPTAGQADPTLRKQRDDSQCVTTKLGTGRSLRCRAPMGHPGGHGLDAPRIGRYAAVERVPMSAVGLRPRPIVPRPIARSSSSAGRFPSASQRLDPSHFSVQREDFMIQLFCSWRSSWGLARPPRTFVHCRTA